MYNDDDAQLYKEGWLAGHAAAYKEVIELLTMRGGKTHEVSQQPGSPGGHLLVAPEVVDKGHGLQYELPFPENRRVVCEDCSGHGVVFEKSETTPDGWPDVSIVPCVKCEGMGVDLDA